jgi:hypothetical protein
MTLATRPRINARRLPDSVPKMMPTHSLANSLRLNGEADLRKSPEFAEACRRRATAQWADPERRRQQGELTRLKLAPAAMREKISAATKVGHAKPGVRERQLAGVRAAMARPDIRERISAGTIAGIARKRAAKLEVLLEAWRRADRQTQARFLEQIGHSSEVSETKAP